MSTTCAQVDIHRSIAAVTDGIEGRAHRESAWSEKPLMESPGKLRTTRQVFEESRQGLAHDHVVEQLHPMALNDQQLRLDTAQIIGTGMRTEALDQ